MQCIWIDDQQDQYNFDIICKPRQENLDKYTTKSPIADNSTHSTNTRNRPHNEGRGGDTTPPAHGSDNVS